VKQTILFYLALTVITSKGSLLRTQKFLGAEFNHGKTFSTVLQVKLASNKNEKMVILYLLAIFPVLCNEACYGSSGLSNRYISSNKVCSNQLVAEIFPRVGSLPGSWQINFLAAT
jgi:hypothetical protein